MLSIQWWDIISGMRKRSGKLMFELRKKYYVNFKTFLFDVIIYYLCMNYLLICIKSLVLQ